ncbi:MAG: hypothetical protein HOV87_03525 [Catenulispora sp.]|nr:hypothetical protein [Catenulispora sp.]
MTQFVISAQGTDQATDNEDLFQWLRNEPDLRTAVSLSEPQPTAEELGAIAEVAIAAVSGGGTITVLASSLKTFLTQPRGLHIVLKVTRPDSSTVDLDVERVRDMTVHDLAELIKAATSDKQ